MKTYVSDLKAGDAVTSFFVVCDAPAVRPSKKGTDYLVIKFQDCTGQVDGRMWTLPGGFDLAAFKQGTIVKVQGTVSEWNDQKQLAVTQMRVAESSEFVLSDMVEAAPERPEYMLEKLRSMLLTHLGGTTMHSLLSRLIDANAEALMRSAAAKSVHHAYVGGLLQHVLSLCELAIFVSVKYSLRMDLMLAACVCHDVAKTREMDTGLVVSYTTEGSLIGHISIGVEMLNDAIQALDETFPQDLKIALTHLILSHHSKLEWGSPKLPATKEAIAFCQLDLLDSKMAICDKAVAKGLNDKGFTEWVKELEGPVWVMREE